MLKRRHNLPPLVIVRQKTLAELWEEYGPQLNKHYDTEQYIKSTIVKVIKNVSKGANKSINMEGDSNGNIYAVAAYTLNARELETHMKILVQYFKRPRLFDIPLLYKDDWSYVSSYINFDYTVKPKSSKNSLKYCTAEGQFLAFMVNELNLLPLDVESYVSRDTGKLTFLDFGEVTVPKSEEQRREFIKNYVEENHLDPLSPEVRACIVKEIL
jgi:hypothetical protein